MRFVQWMLAICALVLAGCASHAPAPLAERATTVTVEKPVVAVPTPAAPTDAHAKSMLYTVKKGDTLHGIALEHGQDYKDIAAWSNLENPNRIQVGQQLRVGPPEAAATVAVVKPVVIVAPVEARPVQSGGNTETLKREPKGGKVAYSEQALARMRESATMPEKPLVMAEKLPEPVADKPADKAVPVSAPLVEDGLEWAWPSGGKMLATFSEGASGKEASKGIDIGGRTGDAVSAAAAGKVTLVSNSLRGYGNLVVIKHSTAFLSVYAHNSKILVKEGQSVARGQKIAEIGSSDSDQPKLHFEIRRQGKPVDPVKYLPVKE